MKNYLLTLAGFTLACVITKANTMISLNGIIQSVLTLSRPFVLVAEPPYLVPIAVFLAIHVFVRSSLRGWRHNRTPLRETHVDDFRKNKANSWVFEHFASLTKDEDSKLMNVFLYKSERIYRNMTRQLYLLGIAANRKIRLLKISYTSFLIGLT